MFCDFSEILFYAMMIYAVFFKFDAIYAVRIVCIVHSISASVQCILYISFVFKDYSQQNILILKLHVYNVYRAAQVRPNRVNVIVRGVLFTFICRGKFERCAGSIKGTACRRALKAQCMATLIAVLFINQQVLFYFEYREQRSMRIQLRLLYT